MYSLSPSLEYVRARAIKQKSEHNTDLSQRAIVRIPYQSKRLTR